MNLHSRKTRLPIAALGVTALCTTGLGVLAGSAFAAGTTLTYGPTATSATIANVDPGASGAAASANAKLTYGLKVTGSTDSDPLYLSAATANPGSVLMARAPGNGVPSVTTTVAATANATDTVVALTSTAGLAVGDVITFRGGTPESRSISAISGNNVTVAALSNGHAATSAVDFVRSYTGVAANATTAVGSYSNGDNIYLGATTPGSYSLFLFKDHNGNGTYDSAQDDATPAFTLNVKDVTNATATAADNLDFGLSAPSSSVVGQTVTASATLGGLSTTDTRGGSTLANAVAAATTFTFSGATGAAAGTGAPSYSATTGKYTKASGSVSASGTVTTTATLGSAGTASTTTNVVDNGVSGVTLTATDATGTVKSSTTSGATSVAVKTGTNPVTFRARIANSVSPTDLNGRTVYFTLGGTDVANLTTDGTTVDAAAHIFSATTDNDGYATLKVTDGATTPSSYTVQASSNGQTADSDTGAGGNQALPVAYANASAQQPLITSTPAQLTQSNTAANVTVNGKLVDQFGGAFAPTGSDPRQINVTGAATAVAPVAADGTFSYTYTPATTPAVGSTSTLTFTYNGGTPKSATIQWTSNTAPASVTLATPVTGATAVTLQDSTTPDPTQANAGSPAFGNTTGAITGLVKGADGSALSFKAVTLTGDGVLFNTTGTVSASDPLVKSLDVVTNSSGQITGAFAYFTKSGSVKVTATAGTATVTSTVTTSDSSDSYKVIAVDATGAPGENTAITGKITDMFGNPVVGRNVALTLSDGSAGTLANSNPVTDGNGVWSTTIAPAANQDGEVTLTVKLRNAANSATLTSNPTPAAGWATAGLTFSNGEYQDTAKITVAEPKVTISTTGVLVGGGKAKVSGTAPAGRSIKVYVKPAGARTYALGTTVRADAQGEWGVGATIKSTTSFYAESGALVSSVVKTTVYSFQTVSAKALGKGKVEFKIYGVPNTKGTASVWYGSKRLGSTATNSAGDATLTVQSSKGRKSFKVYFAAPGTSLKGTILTGTVK